LCTILSSYNLGTQKTPLSGVIHMHNKPALEKGIYATSNYRIGHIIFS